MQDQTVIMFTLKSDKTISYQPGDRVGGDYVLLTFIAKGGMGVVYRAWHEKLDREFALKLLAPMAMSDLTESDSSSKRAHWRNHNMPMLCRFSIWASIAKVVRFM